MASVDYRFDRPASIRRSNIVLPDATEGSIFEKNTADLHAPQTPPRQWPKPRLPGEFQPLPGAARRRGTQI